MSSSAQRRQSAGARVRMSSTRALKAAPCAGLDTSGCSESAAGAMIHATCGRRPLAASSASAARVRVLRARSRSGARAAPPASSARYCRKPASGLSW
ncbi:Uncharacterised protein [Bordetella pertussis]|nr:Uncharacterised protein [Bordetella pertussis]